MGKTKKILIIYILTIILSTICFIGDRVYAKVPGVDGSSGSSYDSGIAGSGSSASDDGLGDLNNYIGEQTESTKIKEKAGMILGIIRTIGVVASVVMLMVIGVKYMLASVEERADYKKTLIPYIVGAFLLFTGSLVPEIVYQIAQNF